MSEWTSIRVSRDLQKALKDFLREYHAQILAATGKENYQGISLEDGIRSMLKYWKETTGK